MAVFISFFHSSRRGVYWNVSPRKVHVIVIIKQYSRDFQATIVPRAWSQYALSDMLPKWAAASIKKEFVWTDDKAELLLTVTEDYKIKHLVEGTYDYRLT